MACLDVNKRRGSRVEERRVFNYLIWKFFKEVGKEFGGVSTTSNLSFLIPQIGEIWREGRVDKLLTK